MSAQTMADVFAPVEARYAEEISRQTWGHLAPRRNKTYPGYVIWTYGTFGSEYLNPTVLACELDGMESSPWFYDALVEFLQGIGTTWDLDKLEKGRVGRVFRFDGHFRNYKMIGKVSQIADFTDAQQ